MNNNDTESVQISVRRLTWCLEHETYKKRNKSKSDIKKMFNSVISKGDLWEEPEYIPKDILKQKELEKELKEKLQAREQNNKLLDKIMEVDFLEWFDKENKNNYPQYLGDDEFKKLQLMPPLSQVKIIKERLKIYFKEFIWNRVD